MFTTFSFHTKDIFSVAFYDNILIFCHHTGHLLFNLGISQEGEAALPQPRHRPL